jgi:hypothetical protein
LVCYWFEKARKAIETNGLGAAGLVATNSIRGGKNRAVLDAIAKPRAFTKLGVMRDGLMRGCGACVIGCVWACKQAIRLDGHRCEAINANLTARSAAVSADVTTAVILKECSGASFMGVTKSGPFDISQELARSLLNSPNPNQRTNADVLFPAINGADLAKRRSGDWILNFGTLTEADASLYERPFEFAKLHIYPIRLQSRTPKNHSVWWQFERSRPEMFAAFGSQPRYIATCLVAKHRFFVWQHRQVVPENVVIVVARADDTTFGILHSRFHELWSLRMGTSLEDRPRYTPTTCFETFPFPAGLTPADTAHQRTETLEDGAVIPADISLPNRPLALAIVRKQLLKQ